VENGLFRYVSWNPPHYLTLTAPQMRAAKHLLNEPSTLVVDSLTGLANSNPRVKLDVQQKGMYAIAIVLVF